MGVEEMAVLPPHSGTEVLSGVSRVVPPTGCRMGEGLGSEGSQPSPVELTGSWPLGFRKRASDWLQLLLHPRTWAGTGVGGAPLGQHRDAGKQVEAPVPHLHPALVAFQVYPVSRCVHTSAAFPPETPLKACGPRSES